MKVSGLPFDTLMRMYQSNIRNNGDLELRKQLKEAIQSYKQQTVTLTIPKHMYDKLLRQVLENLAFDLDEWKTGT